MKIALIIPPRHKGRWVSREYKDGYYDLPHPPYLMLSIAGLIRREWTEAELEVIDAQLEGLTVEDVRKRIRKFDAAVVSLGIISIHSDALFTHLPCPTIGVLPASLDKKFALTQYRLGVTAITHTEIEWTVLEALRAIASNTPLEEVKGLYLNKGNNPRLTAPPVHRPMSLLPMPAFDLVDITAYLDFQEAEAGTRYFYLFTQRGCPFNCYFCAPPAPLKPPLSAKTPSQVIKEIEWLYHKYGITSYYFMDDEFALDMNRAKEICRKILEKKLNIRFVIYNHVNFMDEELAQLLARAGCTFIRYGVETGSTRIAKEMNKFLEFENIKRTFKITQDAGMGTDAFFLLGFPGEDKTILRLNRALVKLIRPDRVTLGIVFPKPYSRMYYEMRAKGLLYTDDWGKLFANNLCFKHEYWRDTSQLYSAFKKFSKSCSRWICWWHLWEGGRLGLSLKTRLFRWVKTLPLIDKFAKSLKQKYGLPSWYQAQRKLEL